MTGTSLKSPMSGTSTSVAMDVAFLSDLKRVRAAGDGQA
jgi:hypothetical protein